MTTYTVSGTASNACVCAALAFLSAAASANPPLTVGDVTAVTGRKVSGAVSVAGTGDGKATVIPVTVVNGSADGPVLALVAGIHGAEYSPIVAMQQLAGHIDPAELSGAVIIVHIANLPAFRGRTIYFGPDDLKNLNRSFPGDPGGTITERIAHAITDQIIGQSDYLIDIHSGDANESLRPSYSAYYADAGDAALIEQSRRMAVAFGLGIIVQFRGEVGPPETAVYTSAQAVARGVPAMDVESGELGLAADRYVEPIVEGALSVMRELEMLPGTSAAAQAPLFIGERARVYSDHDGIWYANERVRTGDFVNEGSLLGVITDYHGNPLAEITAPASGILLILFATPPVNQGDNLAVVGLVGQ